MCERTRAVYVGRREKDLMIEKRANLLISTRKCNSVVTIITWLIASNVKNLDRQDQ